MPLRQLRNHAISLSLGRSTLRPVSAAGMDARIIFGPQLGTGSVRHPRPGLDEPARLLRPAGQAAPMAASSDRWSHLNP
jgi:hypothetical protein